MERWRDVDIGIPKENTLQCLVNTVRVAKYVETECREKRALGCR